MWYVVFLQRKSKFFGDETSLKRNSIVVEEFFLHIPEFPDIKVKPHFFMLFMVCILCVIINQCI